MEPHHVVMAQECRIVMYQLGATVKIYNNKIAALFLLPRILV